MKKLLLITVFALSATYVYAQITFQKTFGREKSEIGYSVQQTADSGYIVAGMTLSIADVFDAYLIKTTAHGDILWTKTFGGVGDDDFKSVQQTSDSGYIIVGRNTDWHVYLIKTNINGDTLWTKTFGGTAFDNVGNSVQQTSDGGYIIAGYSSSFDPGNFNYYLIKTTANGDILWTKTYGGTNPDYCASMKQTTDSGYIIVGRTYSFGAGNDDVYLIKTNSTGDTLWTKTYGGTGSDGGNFVQQTIDGGYIITGFTSSFGAGNKDVYLIKTNADGNLLWTKTYGGTGIDIGWSILKTNDGGFIIAGDYSVGAGNQDVYLIKTNANGDTLWTKTFGGPSYDNGYFVQQTNDGGYIITGRTISFGFHHDIYLIKTDANGNSGCNQGKTLMVISNPATQQISFSTIITTPAIMVFPSVNNVGSGGTVTTLCFSSGISELSSGTENINIYPNPATNNLTIETPQKASIEIINIQGQIIKTLQTTEDKTQVDVSALVGGVYFIKLKTSEGNVIKKFVKQ